MVNRIFVEKKTEYAHESKALRDDIVNLLQISSLEGLRVINRYDVEGINDELFNASVKTVFSEPQIDDVYGELQLEDSETSFAVEYLPGQFDQRAASAAECIQIISQGERPDVKTAKVYILKGSKLTYTEIEAIKNYLINPVEAREAPLGEYCSLKIKYEIPEKVETIEGFTDFSQVELGNFLEEKGLAMDMGDLLFCQEYFKKEKRNPTITEIKVIDTYWSDHCRHTTFNTIIDSVEFEDEEIAETYNDYIDTREVLGRSKKPVTLMDLGTISARYLKKNGLLDKLDESEEINACTVKVKIDVEGREENWLLFFKNETHNHPTEIEPFGGAATCVGGAIRDPLSGRSYVYGAIRVTGAGDPLTPVSETMNGKLPQRKIVTTAAKGYSSYGNQIGLATGQVDEIYHPGYRAKRMEIGAVVGAAPEENVIRKKPTQGDVVILLGGKTGRDGCGGATGSSKSHTLESLESCGAEVQKGNPPEERKLQRLFRNPEASKLIKRCNDFGAGGVSVAIGELADGLEVDLNKVPKKYEGLDGTELAISESQERMAVVVAEENAEKFAKLAYDENLETSIVAKVTEEPRLVLKWNGEAIVDISRDFLDTNGADKHTEIVVEKGKDFSKTVEKNINFADGMKALVSDLNICSKRGLSEGFDSTIGGATVIMPFGGKFQKTPNQAMVNLFPVENKTSNTCSLMTWGYNPFITEKNPYAGGYLAVIESVSKLIASGAAFEAVYLSFQEYFEKLGKIPERWGKPMAALLGAYKAQKALSIAAIGGKDSMSGSFEEIDVPPTLVSFAVTTADADLIVSPEFKGVDHKIIMLQPEFDKKNLPKGESLIKLYAKVHELIKSKNVISCYTPTLGGVAEAIYKMTLGNEIGFTYHKDLNIEDMFSYAYGTFIIELAENFDISKVPEGILLGKTSKEYVLQYGDTKVKLKDLDKLYEEKLETVYPMNYKDKTSVNQETVKTFNYEREQAPHASYNVEKPKVLIPVFPGTNCEYDSAKAFELAGGDAEVFVINNQSPEAISKSIKDFASKIEGSHIIFIPGGFSGGDEPDGSGKLITAFFRNEEIKKSLKVFLDEREGLMAGICNGFQALIKLGLLPYGKIVDATEDSLTLTYNVISRHQSKIVNTRVASNKSPWMSHTKTGNVYQVPISHGEGRLIGSEATILELADNGQILTQYVDFEGNPTMDIQFNPNGSYYAIEGMTSPDGRILGKMGHSERIGKNLYKNVPGNYDMKMFKSAIEYFK